MTNLPKSKDQNIVVQVLEDEVLIYNLANHKAYCLNETSAIVYRACDGETSFEELKRKHRFSDEVIFFALDNLKKEGLIETAYDSPLKGMKRREVLKKIGLATAIALPVIASVSMPTAIQAASCGGTLAPQTFLGCTPTAQNCLNMFQMCLSCATVAAPEPLCPVDAPVGCTCI